MYTEKDFLSYGIDVIIHPQAIIKHPNLCKIGNHVAIDNVTFSTIVNIGDYVHIAPYVCIIGGKTSCVTFEHFSFAASGTKIVAGSDDYTGLGLIGPTIPLEYRSVTYTHITFKPFSGCGVNCSILPGIVFNEGSVLGANSLATTDLEPWTIYVGSPAKPIKTRDRKLILENAKKLGYEF